MSDISWNLRDAMIEVIRPIVLGPSPHLKAWTGRDEQPAKIADAILDLLDRSTAEEPE